MSSEKKIKAFMIIEVIGKPPEHLIETLEEISRQIDSEKGVKIITKNVKEPIELKDAKKFYTTFAEIEFEVEEVMQIALLMFKYMPSHIEIIEPGTINFTNTDLCEVLNEITRRMHAYDEVVRVFQNEKDILEKKLKELIPEKETKEEKPKTRKKKK